jgi:hypothetical protein
MNKTRKVNYETDGHQGSATDPDRPLPGVYRRPTIEPDTILLEDVLSIAPAKVERIVNAWSADLRRKYKYVIEAETSVRNANQMDIKALAMYGDWNEEEGKSYNRSRGFDLLGKISLSSNLDKTHVTLSFYDWEPIWMDRERMEETMRMVDFPTIPHAREIFEDLAGRLRVYELIEESEQTDGGKVEIQNGKIEKIDSKAAMNTTTMIVNSEQKIKDLLDDACKAWAGRRSKGYIPKHLSNMEEFLDWLCSNNDIPYITKDQFKKALKDAGERGIIKKEGRYWTLP